MTQADVQSFVQVCLAGADLGTSAPEAEALARDIAALYGLATPAQIKPRLPMMAVRAAARVRAAAAPVSANGPDAAQNVTIHAARQPYAAFFAVEEYDLTHTRFDGTPSAHLRRAVFVSGDAVTVLPYDPVRRRVLLVQQFRSGPFARGDVHPWQYEAIAGRIDAGEAPETAARREAVEEAGLSLGDLHFVAGYYPSPGILSEYLYSYVGLCDLPDNAAGTFGLATEGEDILGHIVPLDDLIVRISGAQGGNAPLILTALWLWQNQHRFG